MASGSSRTISSPVSTTHIHPNGHRSAYPTTGARERPPGTAGARVDVETAYPVARLECLPPSRPIANEPCDEILESECRRRPPPLLPLPPPPTPPFPPPTQASRAVGLSNPPSGAEADDPVPSSPRAASSCVSATSCALGGVPPTRVPTSCTRGGIPTRVPRAPGVDALCEGDRRGAILDGGRGGSVREGEWVGEDLCSDDCSWWWWCRRVFTGDAVRLRGDGGDMSSGEVDVFLGEVEVLLLLQACSMSAESHTRSLSLSLSLGLLLSLGLSLACSLSLGFSVSVSLSSVFLSLFVTLCLLSISVSFCPSICVSVSLSLFLSLCVSSIPLW